MDSKKIQASTLVSPSRLTCWSQAYAAGNLFAVVSLTTQEETVAETDTLGVIGKEILNTLEAEYFTIEIKNLESINNAITVAIKHAVEKPNIVLSACFATVIENVLYIFALGGAKIYMKRQDKLGLLLSGQEPTLISASGFLENNDLVILQTKTLGEIISKEKLIQAAQQTNPAEITEYLSPLIQEYEKGGAAGVILLYNHTQKDSQKEEAASHQSYVEPKKKVVDFKNITQMLLPFIAATRAKLGFIELTRKRKLFLGISVILIILLIFGVIYTTKQKEKAIQQALFQEVYAGAQKKFDEGQGLAGLNKNLSRDNLNQAQKIIADNKDKFNNNKILKEKLDTLLKNIEDGLLTVSGVNRVDAKQGDNTMLSIALENNSKAVTQDEKLIYTIDNKAITSIDKKTKDKKTLIQNKDSWKTVGGLGVFLGNIYVLDRDVGQILKFVDSNSNNYFSSKQDLSKATSIAIDGSIFILYSDGTIQKWTRGKQDSFTVSGLDEQFKNPTRISTDADTNNLYILDNGNARIVVLKKNGVYDTQYQTDVIKTATEFDVLEKEKKIFILSKGKIWQIDIK